MDAVCPACTGHFEARLIHNGFNNSSYAYCAKCGTTALCTHSAWPVSVPKSDYGPLLPEQISHLRRCTCGGAFHTHAMPRCPGCQAALDPIEATSWIESGSAGTEGGWRWQGSWLGIHAVVVGDIVLENPWSEDSAG